MKKKLSEIISFNKFLNKRLSTGFQQRLHLIMLREKTKIQALRKDWHIPVEKGFLTKNKWKHWWKNLRSIVPEKTRDIKYTELEIFHIFHKFKTLKTIKSTDSEVHKRVIIIKNNPQAVFDFEIKKFINYLKLDQELHNIVRDYIWFNHGFKESIENTGIILSERITYDNSDKESERKLSLIFGPNTDNIDLSAIYYFQLDNRQKNIPGYFKKKLLPIKRFSRCCKIAEMLSEGKTDWQIKNYYSNLGIDLSIDLIRKIIKRIKSY